MLVFVTVTVYVPGVVTVIFAVVAPLLQLYVSPDVGVAFEVIVELVVLQVKVVALAETLTVGFIVLPDNVAEAVVVQPLFDTVTVYVPAVETVVVADVAPLLHEYVNPVVGDVADAVKFIEVTVHVKFAVLGETVTPLGYALTKTLVVTGALVTPPTVITNEYVPDIAVVTFAIVGFCCVDDQPLGPVQRNVAPAGGLFAVRDNVSPTHNGPLLLIGGATIEQSVEPEPDI